MIDEVVNRFSSLFTGLVRAYGQWSIKDRPRTVLGHISDVQWEAHLSGKVGLGVVPIRDDGTCVWGAIDIDVDDINHMELAKNIEIKKLPLIVCRSKSGGAHCYIFYDKPTKASTIIKQLSRYASILSFGGCEVFPKQTKLSQSEVGNWINLPYFDYQKTTRMAWGPDGQLTLNEFIQRADEIKQQSKQLKDNTPKDMIGAPPCLVQLLEQGIIDGQRNEGLYNYAVYYRKRLPDTWEDAVVSLNYSLFDHPLPMKEVQSIIKSVAKKNYIYKCSQAPINAVCDRPECITREFGIKSVDGSYETIMVGSITKILTDPPRWSIEINGIDLILSTEEIMDYRKVRIMCLEKVDMVAPPMKQEDWLQIIKNRMQTKTITSAPEDTGNSGQIKAALIEFISMADRARDRSDVLRGIPVEDIINKDKVILFKSSDFINFLKRKKVDFTAGPALWLMLRGFGCDHSKIRIQERVVQVWCIPIDDQKAIKFVVPRSEVEI